MSPRAEGPRLGAHTFTFRHETLPAALEGIAAAGAGRAEVWAGHAHWTRARPDEVRAALGAAGLELTAYCVGGFYGTGAPVAEQAAAAFAFAREIGTTLVTGCLGAGAYGPVAGAAEAAGVRLAVENHWYQALARPRDLALLRHPALGLNLDTGHAMMAGVAPEDFVGAAGARVLNVHLKDVPAPGWRARIPVKVRRRLAGHGGASLPVGRGDLRLGALRDALARAGFGGPVAVEVEGSADPRGDLEISLAAAGAGLT